MYGQSIVKVNNTNWKRKRSRTGRVPIQNGIQLAIPSSAFITRPGGEKINSFREAEENGLHKSAIKYILMIAPVRYKPCVLIT